MATQAELADAINLICSHVASKLPPDWAVVLLMEKNQEYWELHSPCGHEVELPSEENGIGMIDALCELAIKESKRKV